MKNGVTEAAEQREVPPASARAEAAAWVAHLHSSKRTKALETGFRRWLQADAAHAVAFEMATEAWDLGGAIPASRFPRVAQLAPARRSSAIVQSLAIAAGLCVIVLGTTLYFNRDSSAVMTGLGEQRMLTLDDGSRIFLNTGTRLTVKYDKAHRSVQLDAGEAMFDVAQDAKRPFTVAAGDKEVLALGTVFMVRRETNELSVTLMEGKVQVDDQKPLGFLSTTPAPDLPKILTPGERVTYAEGKSSKLDEPSLDKVTAWRRGEVVLDKTRLADAATEMNRYSPVKLVVEDPAAADIRLSGIFRTGDSARFAEAVAETYHLQTRHEQAAIVISAQ